MKLFGKAMIQTWGCWVESKNASSVVRIPSFDELKPCLALQYFKTGKFYPYPFGHRPLSLLKVPNVEFYTMLGF